MLPLARYVVKIKVYLRQLDQYLEQSVPDSQCVLPPTQPRTRDALPPTDTLPITPGRACGAVHRAEQSCQRLRRWQSPDPINLPPGAGQPPGWRAQPPASNSQWPAPSGQPRPPEARFGLPQSGATIHAEHTVPHRLHGGAIYRPGLPARTTILRPPLQRLPGQTGHETRTIWRVPFAR